MHAVAFSLKVVCQFIIQRSWKEMNALMYLDLLYNEVILPNVYISFSNCLFLVIREEYYTCMLIDRRRYVRSPPVTEKRFLILWLFQSQILKNRHMHRFVTIILPFFSEFCSKYSALHQQLCTVPGGTVPWLQGKRTYLGTCFLVYRPHRTYVCDDGRL